MIAVSAGGDSVALLHLIAQLADTLPPLLAATVDHGLRPESADEARWVSDLCKRLGVEHHIATLAEVPTTGIAAWAREWRHQALREAAGPGGIVLVGHTADDVAETVMMRAARGPGPGLAGIAPATLVGTTWFYRPLIGASRQSLRRWLQGRGEEWIDDPTNTDPTSERARVRGGMTGPERSDALRLAALHRAERERNAAQAAAVLSTRLHRGPDGAVVEEWNALGWHRATVLRALLPLVAHRAHAPATPVLDRAVRALESGERFTVGGCVLACERPRRDSPPPNDQALVVTRDLRARRDAGSRIVPSYEWPLHRVIEPDAPPPPVPLEC